MTYSYTENVNLWFGTWNVNGECNKKEIDLFLKTTFSLPPDMFVLGLEEMVPLNISTVLLNLEVEERRKTWIDLVQSILLTRYHIVLSLFNLYQQSYSCIASEALVGISIFVFVSSASSHHFSHIQSLFVRILY